MKQFYITLIVFCIATTVSFAQMIGMEEVEEEFAGFRYPVVSINAGILSFVGDVKNENNTISQVRNNTIFALSVEQRLGYLLGVSISGSKGRFSENTSGINTLSSFQTKVFQSHAKVNLYFWNFSIWKKDFTFSPYVSAGIGYMNYSSYNDLYDADGNKYYFWSNYTVKDRPFDDPDVKNAKTLARDYEYETPIGDKHNALILPLGIGMKMKLTKQISVGLQMDYYFTSTDFIDNYVSSENNGKDAMIYSSVSLSYKFTQDMITPKVPYYLDVDFEELDKEDEDGDGITDFFDECPDTPYEAKIDDKGCPLDSDNDGVHDLIDDEISSEENSVVDIYGKTLTPEDLHEMYVFDSLVALGKAVPINLLYDTIKNENLLSIEQQMEDLGLLERGYEVIYNEGKIIIQKADIKKYYVMNPNFIEGLVYKIQISATNSDAKESYFRKRFGITESIEIRKERGIYKYLIGDYYLFKDVTEVNNELKKRTNEAFFIVAYLDGERIKMDKVKHLIKSRKKKLYNPDLLKENKSSKEKPLF